ncbi:MAG: type II toxin-antitoxin system prevent-host-death family antitoxin [Alphaproteobacteria bacterium]|nr:type II toxin-antitoxin system prevent-host-death family antitoxin [Alphaproteobacteria bacterium]
MTVVTVHHAKTHLSKLIAAAERGEEVVIARGNKPAVRLVPAAVEIAPKPQVVRTPGRLKGLVSLDESFFEPMSEEDLQLWEGKGRDY